MLNKPGFNFSSSNSDAKPNIFYHAPHSSLNNFINFRKPTTPNTLPMKITISPAKLNLKPSYNHKKNSKSMDVSTPIYIVNNKKNYIIYNDIKMNNSFLNSPPMIYTFSENQKKEFTSSTKKTLNDHYQQIFQKNKNFSHDTSKIHPLQTPCFKASPIIIPQNENKPTLFTTRYNQTTNSNTHQELKPIESNSTNYKNLNKIKGKTSNFNFDPLERKEKCKNGKKIDETDIGSNTGEASQFDVLMSTYDNRKETTKMGKSINPNKGKNEKKRWSDDEDKLLVESFQKFSTVQKKINKWDFIASQINSRNPSQCKQRYKRLVKPDNVRKKWSELEDNVLRNFVEVEKLASWEIIADKLKAKGFFRTGKQVRERYINHLDPSINMQPFKEEEDILIIKYFKVFGNKWAKIAKYLIQRSENSVKNRFHYHLKKKFLSSEAKLEINFEETLTNKIETESFSGEELDMDEVRCMEIFGVPLENVKFSKGFSAESEKAYKELKNEENSFI